MEGRGWIRTVFTAILGRDWATKCSGGDSLIFIGIYGISQMFEKNILSRWNLHIVEATLITFSHSERVVMDGHGHDSAAKIFHDGRKLFTCSSHGFHVLLLNAFDSYEARSIKLSP